MVLSHVHGMAANGRSQLSKAARPRQRSGWRLVRLLGSARSFLSSSSALRLARDTSGISGLRFGARALPCQLPQSPSREVCASSSPSRVPTPVARCSEPALTMRRILARTMDVRLPRSTSSGSARLFASGTRPAAAAAASSPVSPAAAASTPVGPTATAGSSSHAPSPPSASPTAASGSSSGSPTPPPPATGHRKDPPSLFRVALLSALTAGALYLVKLAWDIEHEEDVMTAVDRWIEQLEAEATQSPLLPPPAPPSRIASLLTRSGPSIYVDNAAQESLGDPRVLAALASVHPALPRMERMTRRLIVWPGLNFFSRLDLCKIYAEQQPKSESTPESAAGQPQRDAEMSADSTAFLHQQCVSKLNNPSLRRRHERNAMELLGVARVLEVLAPHHERPEEIQQVARCRFEEAATLLRAIIKHYREVIPPAQMTTTATAPSSSTAASPAAASPPAPAPVPMHLHLGLVSALLGAHEFGAAMAELDTAQQAIESPHAATLPPEHKEHAQKKIAQCKSAIEKAKGTQTI